MKEKGATVLFACSPALARLFATVPGIDRIVPEISDAAYDCHAPLMSLPRLCNTTLATIPAKIPYLSAEPEKISAWRERLAHLPGKKIGIVWRGNPQHSNDRNRSIPAATFATALPPGLSLVNLQKDAQVEELSTFADHKLFNAAPDLHDFADTAALIATLDLVITVDTSICHLAGALGVRAWTLLPSAPDWRWLLDRADSPWYPTMRLCRADQPGDWTSVLKTIREELLNSKF